MKKAKQPLGWTELVERVARHTGVSQTLADDAARHLFETLGEWVLEQHRVEVPNFGVFRFSKIRARKGVSIPIQEGTFDLPPAPRINFKPSKKLLEKARPLVR